MLLEDENPISVYEDVAPLCEKSHVMLVRNKENGNFYVKKCFKCYNPEIYMQLKHCSIEGIPAIYDIYFQKQCKESTKIGSNITNIITIEEYFSGSTIAETLQEKGLFSEKETIRIGRELCQILIHLHKQKPAIIHRDIKPSNIMLLPDGSVRLIDFNAAKTQSQIQTKDTVLMGTAGFAAPEQYGFLASSPKTDIYAIGVLMNLMLCGKMPTEKIAEGKLRDIIKNCLELNPKDRYFNVKELQQSLNYLEKVKVKWLPPGFRTVNIFKMVIAVVCYSIFFVFLTSVKREDYATALQWHMFRWAFTAMWFLIIIFYCNYLNLKKRFPLMRSSKKYIRMLGHIFMPFFIFWAVIIVVSIIELLVLR